MMLPASAAAHSQYKSSENGQTRECVEALPSAGLVPRFALQSRAPRQFQTFYGASNFFLSWLLLSSYPSFPSHASLPLCFA